MSEPIAISWSFPPALRRGCVVDAVVASDDDIVLQQALEDAWSQACDLAAKLGDPDQKWTVTAEIWQDSGRIIFALRQRRELARIVVTCASFESRYFQMVPDETTFEAAYSVQHDRIAMLLENAYLRFRERHPSGRFADSVAIRDSDDDTTRRLIG